MTPYGELFHTYKSWDDQVIYLDENMIYPMVGMGDVQIKMFDGVIRTISNV